MLRRSFRVAPLAACLCLAAACGGSDAPTAPSIESATFAPSLNVNLAASTRTASGLYYRDLTVGAGAVAGNGQSVTVTYSGYLTSGSKFDGTSSVRPSLPFTIGARQVVDGFDEGVRGMRVGGTRQLIIPPSLGYGARGNGPIPPQAIIIFEVGLVGVQ